jgi:hypothetical protein
MKEYDLISIGTGSAMHTVDVMLQRDPNLKVAVIDKDEPGGINIFFIEIFKLVSCNFFQSFPPHSAADFPALLVV